MNAIVTVIGKDRVGIIAAITAKLAEYKINILDISQTILNGSFTMVMSVDMNACPEKFEAVKRMLDSLGEEMGLSIHIQRTEIFEAMHTI